MQGHDKTRCFNMITEAAAIRGRVTRLRVLKLLSSARQNADDTVPCDDWNRIFEDSAAVLLSERGVHRNVTEWFAQYGIKA